MGERVARWYLVAPEVVYGQNSVTPLAQLGWKSASTVTASNTADLGSIDRVEEQLPQAGIGSGVFDRVEPERSLQTARIDSETWDEESKNGNHVWVG